MNKLYKILFFLSLFLFEQSYLTSVQAAPTRSQAKAPAARKVGSGQNRLQKPKVKSTGGASALSKAKYTVIEVSLMRYPQSANHILDAQKNGHSKVLTIDRPGAKANRLDSLRGIKTIAGMDRDEYPPAMFKEGGMGASVRLIKSSDNRGAGACIGGQCRSLPNGAQVILKVVP